MGDAEMKNIVILGAGTAGTMMANKVRRELDKNEWNITLIDTEIRVQVGDILSVGELYEFSAGGQVIFT